MATLPDPPHELVRMIDEVVAAKQDDGFRAHLGASRIGAPCERALWYLFRWCTKARHEGRILRLFARGQREEAVMIDLLRRVGVEIDDGDGEQWSCAFHGKHFGGSVDAVARGIPEAPKTWHVCEFKTHGSKSFKELAVKGVQKSKPQHWAQCQVYMEGLNLDRALYLAVNKDTDELYAERIHREKTEAVKLLERAERIIFGAVPPSRINEDPSWFECRFCDHRTVCHDRAPSAVTCRSCIHSTPEPDGDARWSCASWSADIPIEAQRKGCERHVFITALVRGEQVDITETGIVYDWGEQGPDGVPSIEYAKGGAAVVTQALKSLGGKVV